MTIPTLAGLRTLSPIIQPLWVHTATNPSSFVSSYTVNTASCLLGSNFWPTGSYYTKPYLPRTLSITAAVITYPSKFDAKFSFKAAKSTCCFIFSTSLLFKANLIASLTSSKSLENFVIAKTFSSSIILRYLFTVSSFSLTCLVYSTRARVTSPLVLSWDAFNSSIYLTRDSISFSYSLNNCFIFLTSSFEISESESELASGFVSSLTSSFFSF